ncbi:MAG: asparagine synthase-related protein [Acidimicrobiales bacterium]
MKPTGSELAAVEITSPFTGPAGTAWHWYKTPAIAAAGRAFAGSRLLHGRDLANHLLKAHHEGQLMTALADLNGAFAFVIGSSDGPVVAGTDRLRSIPLFYTWDSDGHPRVAADPRQLRLEPIEPDGADAACFLRCGYTFGPHTLHPEVCQVRPGTFVSFGTGRALVEQRYHRHLRCLPPSGTGAAQDRSFDRLDEISTTVGRRLVEVLDGRQALVPLSGGYDSRYVVSMLAEHGYDNVQLLTYGTPTGIEARIASQVAEAFGYPWEFVDYTAPGELARFVRSEAFGRYWAGAGGLSSLPHIQEPYALAELRRRGLVADDAVAVPGFCGDLLGGSFLPTAVLTNRVDELLQVGLAGHLEKRLLYLANPLDPQQWDGLHRRLGESMAGHHHPRSIEEFVSEANAWIVEHRVARYVINALRAYEAAGIDWYTPLWDTALTDFWYEVPVADLVAKKLYNGYLLDRRFPRQNVAIHQYPSYWSSRWFRQVRGLVPRAAIAPLWRLRDRITGTRRFDVNAFGPIAEWGNEPLGAAAPPYAGNISAVLVNRYLHDVSPGLAGAAGTGDGSD